MLILDILFIGVISAGASTNTKSKGGSTGAKRQGDSWTPWKAKAWNINQQPSLTEPYKKYQLVNGGEIMIISDGMSMRRKYYLIEQLLNLGYFKTPDGRQLFEVTSIELEEIYLSQMDKEYQTKAR